jgi:hypothetical protein
MRVESVNQATQSTPQSDVVARLQVVTQMIGRQRAQGAEEVQLLLRANNDVDGEVVKRLSRLYNVNVEDNGGSSVRISVRFK